LRSLGWSGREDDGSAGVAANCLSECLGSVGEPVAGGDRDLKLRVPELPREFAQLDFVGADVDAGDRDAALLARRVWGDSRQPSAVGTARIALAAPPRAAFTAAETPCRPVIARTCCSGHS
jgi:hypothetical protein